MEPDALGEIRIDALREPANIGAGHAATALSELSGRRVLVDVPEEYRRKLLGLNAAEVYKFDIDKLLPLAQKFGPTPGQVNEPLPRDEIPRDSMCYLFQNALYN